MAQPHHCDTAVVSGKVQLIGRAYSAAPNRGVRIERFDEGVADAIVARGSELDLAIATAQESSRISMSTVSQAVGTHRLLNEIIMDFISNSLGGAASRGLGHRDSFCSKYLHFHAPMAFPIYDSKAVDALRRRRASKRYTVVARGEGRPASMPTFAAISLLMPMKIMILIGGRRDQLMENCGHTTLSAR